MCFTNGCPRLFLCVFVREKKNKSGVISIQIIDKSTGKYKLIKTIGSSADVQKIISLKQQGEAWIRNHLGQFELDFGNENKIFSDFIDGIQSINVAGPELLLGKIFNEIGFNKIREDLFKRLVLARLCFPGSKLKTTELMERYHSIGVDVDVIYRYMDKLYNTQKQTVQDISYRHTLKLFNNNITVVFYDVTTLYFEIDNEDDFRKTGFSKDGKHQHPQIVLGLLVSIDGYPLAYDLFEGNKFEGHTMIPIIEGLKKKYELTQLIVVADSGLMSEQNIAQLQSHGYEYILGARIKSESASMKEKILKLKLKNGKATVIDKNEQQRLIISYSTSRAKKDKANRDKGIQKLEKQIKAGKLTKAQINNKGYNKYLKLTGEIKVSIDREKLKAEQSWDGLKGYITNTKMPATEIIENYRHLWKIEKAFRISKTDLKIRPIFHRLKHRIEAHITIAFVAYKVYKELERQLKEKESDLSPERAIEIAKSIYAIKVKTPLNHETMSKILFLTEEQKYLAELFQF